MMHIDKSGYHLPPEAVAPIDVPPLSNPKKLHHEVYVQETYQEVTSYLTSKELNSLEGKMALIVAQKEKLNLIKEIINRGDIDHPLFRDENFSLYTLYLLKSGQINGMAFTTSQLFHNAFRNNTPHRVQSIPLFSSIGKDMLDETLKLYIDAPNINKERKEMLQDSNFVFLDSVQRKHFEELVSELPELERQFLLVPEPNPMGKDDIFVSQRIITASSFNVFGRYKNCRVIPSKGMIQAYLIALNYQSAHPDLVTRLKLAPIENMEKLLLEGQRPFSINLACLNNDIPPTPVPFEFTNVNAPNQEYVINGVQITEADQHICNPQVNDSENHDFYHGDAMAHIPREHYKPFYGLTKILRDSAAEMPDPEIAKSFHRTADLMVDMEHPVYRTNKILKIPITDRDIWTSLKMVLDKYIDADHSSVIKRNIMGHFIRNSDFYRSEYGLGCESLKEFKIMTAGVLTPNPNAPDPHYSTKNLLVFDIMISGMSLDVLIARSKDPNSYIYRDAVLEEIEKRLTPENCEEILSKARLIGASKVIASVVKFYYQSINKRDVDFKMTPESLSFVVKRLQVLRDANDKAASMLKGLAGAGGAFRG